MVDVVVELELGVTGFTVLEEVATTGLELLERTALDVGEPILVHVVEATVGAQMLPDGQGTTAALAARAMTARAQTLDCARILMTVY